MAGIYARARSAFVAQSPDYPNGRGDGAANACGFAVVVSAGRA